MAFLKIPSIPVPGEDIKSLQASVQSLKEAVELMAGMRGDSPFMLVSDQGEKYSKRVAQIEKSPASAWEVAFNQTVLNTTGFNVLNLGKYRMLRFYYYMTPPVTSGTGIWHYMRVGNGGSMVATAGAYINTVKYMNEGAATITGWNSSDTVIPLSLGNIIAANPFGLHIEMTIMDWNKAVQTIMFVRGTYFNGTNINLFDGVFRESGAAARDSLHLAFNGDATAMNCHLYIEGLVG